MSRFKFEQIYNKPRMEDLREVKRLPRGFERRVCEFLSARRGGGPYRVVLKKHHPIWAPQDGADYCAYMKSLGLSKDKAHITGRSAAGFPDAKWRALWFMYSLTSGDWSSSSPAEVELRLAVAGY